MNIKEHHDLREFGKGKIQTTFFYGPRTVRLLMTICNSWFFLSSSFCRVRKKKYAWRNKCFKYLSFPWLGNKNYWSVCVREYIDIDAYYVRWSCRVVRLRLVRSQWRVPVQRLSTATERWFCLLRVSRSTNVCFRWPTTLTLKMSRWKCYRLDGSAGW